MGGHNDKREKYRETDDERNVLHSDETIGVRHDSGTEAPDGARESTGSHARSADPNPRHSVFTDRRNRKKRGEHSRDWTVEPSGD
jgi:hypothetical protein